MKARPRAWRVARQIVEDLDIKSAPVDVDAVAGRWAHLVYQDMSDEISGMLIPLEQKVEDKGWAIVVNKNHARVRQRFTVAHELAHLLLHNFTTPHADSAFRVRFRDSRSSDGSVLEEIQANQFAAELLMPRHLLMQRLRDEHFEYVGSDIEGSEQLSKLAREFGVSSQALSIRLSSLLGEH